MQLLQLVVLCPFIGDDDYDFYGYVVPTLILLAFNSVFLFWIMGVSFFESLWNICRMQFFLSIRFFLFNQSIFGPEIMCKIEFSKLDSYHIHTKQKQNRAGIKTFNNISIFIIEIHFVQKFGIDIIPFPKAANLHMQNF